MITRYEIIKPCVNKMPRNMNWFIGYAFAW